MSRNNRLSTLEYMQTLFGNTDGAKFNSYINASIAFSALLGIAMVSFAALAPSLFGAMFWDNKPPEVLLSKLPLYFRYYEQIGSTGLGARIWWTQIVSVAALAMLLATALVLVVHKVVYKKRARVGLFGIPMLNPSTIGIMVFCPILWTLVLTDVWHVLIDGGYRVYFGPTIIFQTFWLLAVLFLGGGLVWHAAFIVVMLFRFIGRKDY